MNSARFETAPDEETRALGRYLASVLPGAAVVSLIGNLGAGKTTLTKGIVEGLGIAQAEDVSSPTYTLVHEYGDPVRVYHVDLYRLDTVEQVQGLGLDELFERPALVLVEWGDRFPQLLPPGHFQIELTYLNEDRRRVELRGFALPPASLPFQAP